MRASWELSFGFNLELDVANDEATRSYFLEFPHTAEVNFQIIGGLGGYLEYVGIWPSDGSGYRALVSTGLVLAITDDLALGGGVALGSNGFEAGLVLTVRF